MRRKSRKWVFQVVDVTSANTPRERKNFLLKEQEVDQSHWGIVSVCDQVTRWNRNLYTWFFYKLPASIICL